MHNVVKKRLSKKPIIVEILLYIASQPKQHSVATPSSFLTGDFQNPLGQIPVYREKYIFFAPGIPQTRIVFLPLIISSLLAMELLTVPLKKASEVDLVKPLKNIIQGASIKQSDSSQNFEKINNFSKQRNHAVFKVFEKNDAALEAINA